MSVHATGQNRLPLPASPIMRLPTIMKMNEPPSRKQPIAIFVTLVGSVPFFFCHVQYMSSSGAKMKMKAGLKDWNHVDGILKPKSSGQTVFSSAHVCIVLPCC